MGGPVEEWLGGYVAGWALDGQVGALALRSPLCNESCWASGIVQRRGGVPAFWKASCFQLESRKGRGKKKKKDKENEVFKGKMQYFPCGRSGKMEHLEGLSQICSQRGLVKLC